MRRDLLSRHVSETQTRHGENLARVNHKGRGASQEDCEESLRARVRPAESLLEGKLVPTRNQRTNDDLQKAGSDRDG